MQDIIDRIHESPWQGVIASTGCAPGLVNDLLAPGGGSATVLEAIVPYATPSLEAFIKKSPSTNDWKFCSAEVAAEMASAAYTRATELAVDNPVFGLGITATLRKRGTEREGRIHQVFLSFQTQEMVYNHHVVMDSVLSRQDEENLVTQIALGVLARHLLGLHHTPTIPSQDPLQKGLDASGYVVKETTERTQFPGSLPKLLSGNCDTTSTVLQTGCNEFFEPLPRDLCSNRIVVPGSFNPTHEGHLQMAQAAHKHFADRKHNVILMELSISNVDKGRLSGYEVLCRTSSFDVARKGNYRFQLCLTDAPTFVEKSFLFPESVFVVGIDTWYRLLDPKYYHHDTKIMDECLDKIRENGCSFLVLGRFVNGKYHTLPSDAKTHGLAVGLSEEEFRVDISSTQLRAQQNA